MLFLLCIAFDKGIALRQLFHFLEVPFKSLRAVAAVAVTPGIVAQLITNIVTDIPLMKGTVPKRLDIFFTILALSTTFNTFVYCFPKCHVAYQVF